MQNEHTLDLQMCLEGQLAPSYHRDSVSGCVARQLAPPRLGPHRLPNPLFLGHLGRGSGLESANLVIVLTNDLHWRESGGTAASAAFVASCRRQCLKRAAGLDAVSCSSPSTPLSLLPPALPLLSPLGLPVGHHLLSHHLLHLRRDFLLLPKPLLTVHRTLHLHRRVGLTRHHSARQIHAVHQESVAV